jgi:CheY-like chemotaxis protein
MGNLELSDATLAALKTDVSRLRDTHSTPDDLEALAGIEEKLDKLTTLLQDGRTGAERVRLILRNLQSLGRRSEDKRVRLDLRSIADSSISIVWSQIKSRATLKRVYENVAEVAGDETRLGQVFLNLLINAYQSIRDPRPDENVIVVTIRQESDFALVEIKDSGVGMSKAQEARVFEPFFTTKRQGEGTGLGLSISRDIVLAHGGHISVDSELGQGTTFTVRLPIWREGMERPSDRPKVLSSHLRLRPTGETRKQIWIVDDDPLVANAMNRMLGRTYEVLVTLGPHDVVARIRAGQSFDALLCDLMMPEMTGMELARLVAAERPELGKRLVFISGGIYTPEAMEFANEPGRYLVEKPFDEQRLRRAIERASES